MLHFSNFKIRKEKFQNYTLHISVLIRRTMKLILKLFGKIKIHFKTWEKTVRKYVGEKNRLKNFGTKKID